MDKEQFEKYYLEQFRLRHDDSDFSNQMKKYSPPDSYLFVEPHSRYEVRISFFWWPLLRFGCREPIKVELILPTYGSRAEGAIDYAKWNAAKITERAAYSMLETYTNWPKAPRE